MQINGIQSYGYYSKAPAFGARFCKEDVDKLIEKAKVSGKPEAIPMLYTMLEYVDKLPGKKAYFGVGDVSSRLSLDNDIRAKVYIGDLVSRKIGEVKGGRESIFEALHNACVLDRSCGTYVRMPERIFEQKWWKNRNKTAEDIRKFSFQEEEPMTLEEMKIMDNL